MKTDIDALTQANNLDALWVMGLGSTTLPWCIDGGGHLTNADLIKKRGQPAILFHAPMERDEAARTGLETRSYNQFPWRSC